MALPGTHFRFALAVRDRYPIANHEHYIAGTLYPDSRWLTGLSREKTHHSDYLASSFADTDFNAGWHVHLLCDHIQAVCSYEAYPQLADLDDEDAWIAASALKVAQDAEDSRQVDMGFCLGCLAYAEAPHGEDLAGVRAYYRLVREAYGAGVPPSQEAYHMLWSRVGVPSQTIAEIMAQAVRLTADEKGRHYLQGLFSEMVRR